MNRRDLIKRAFTVGAAGLLLPEIEPVRKVWALDRTMIHGDSRTWVNVDRPEVGSLYIDNSMNYWIKALERIDTPLIDFVNQASQRESGVITEECLMENMRTIWTMLGDGPGSQGGVVGRPF